ncbi:MAG TPA: hypothetical protein VF456_01110 [Vicinamibacterales bacterium]
MKIGGSAVLFTLVTAGAAVAGPASGSVTSRTGTISPKQAVGYVVRDDRNAHKTEIELLLTDVPVDAAGLRDQLDPHTVAINFDELRDRNYLLLWVAPDGTVSMNATYSKTMTQYINDTSGGLKAELTTNTPTRIEGRVYSPSPLKTMDGPTYTIDVKFSADVIPALSGTALPAGGGDAGKALTTWVAAVMKKDWPGIKAGLSPKKLPMFDRDYDTPKEKADAAADILPARMAMTKMKIDGGMLVNPTMAVLEVEADRFGSRVLELVKMVKTDGVWQYEESVPAGSLR